MFNAVDSYGQTSLHWAASNNDFDNAKDLIEKMSVEEICLCNFDNKYTALHLAAQKGAVKIINLLLEKGQRTLASKVDRYGQTALHWCSYSQEHFPSAEALVQVMEPEDLSIQNDDNKYTVLHLAAQGENVLLIDLLMAKGGHGLACKIDKHEQTALHWSASKGDYQACQILCKYMDRSDIDRKAKSGQTARDFAIAKSYSEIISLLTKS